MIDLSTMLDMGWGENTLRPVGIISIRKNGQKHNTLLKVEDLDMLCISVRNNVWVDHPEVCGECC